MKEKYKKIAICYLGYKYNVKINLNKLDNETLYLFRYNIPSNKSILADLIEYSEGFITNTPYIKQYFYYANSSNTGFRMNIIKKLHKDLLNNNLLGNNSHSIWENHNSVKEEIFGDFFEKNDSIEHFEKDYFTNFDNIINDFSEYIISIYDINNFYKDLDLDVCDDLLR